MGFRNTIAKLEFMPEQHELDEDEKLAVHGIHKCYYKNYKIFYYIDIEKTTVYVLRVLHMLVNAKPLLLKMRFPSFGGVFQPRTFSAQDLSTSELLRTL